MAGIRVKTLSQLAIKMSPIIILFLIFTQSFFAGILPFRSYTTADGLAHNWVRKIYQDKKGFLWFATGEGLSRFDGYEFVNYGVRDGLPAQEINDVAEDANGRLWIAANDDGIALFSDKNDLGQTKKFVSFLINEKDHSANKVNRILFDSKNNLWCLTDNGVYRAIASDEPQFTLVKAYGYPVSGGASMALFEDREGNIWFGIHEKLYEARGGENIIDHGSAGGLKGYILSNALQTKDGKIVVLDEFNGLFEVMPSTSKWRKIADKPSEIQLLKSLIEDDKGSVWLGGSGGIVRLSDENSDRSEVQQNLGGNNIFSLFQDREGVIWSGSGHSGIFKLSDLSIVNYPVAERESSLGVNENDGKIQMLFCDNKEKTGWFCDAKIRNLTNDNFEPFNEIFPNLQNFTVFRDKERWGIIVGNAGSYALKNTIFRFPTGEEIDLKEFFDKDFETSEEIAFYFDESNALWLGKKDLSVWRIALDENGNKKIEKFRWQNYSRPGFMSGDGQGNLWLFARGRRGGRLRNGEFQNFQNFETFPFDPATAFLDSRGWFWIGTLFNGVFVSKNPNDEKPVFSAFSTENGLLSDSVLAIAEDGFGRMYFGTGRGLSRFDPQKNIWNSFTAKDGLTGDAVNSLVKDSKGNIWINTRKGLTRLDSKLERKNAEPPPVYITHIKIAGEEFPLSETGISASQTVSLRSAQNNLTIDFVGLEFRNENSLKYQYKLEGANDDWSSADKNRSISFANLASGNYRFLVRAVNQDGLESANPAIFQFKIYPPIYLRWWFIAFGVFLVSGVIYAFYRLRVQKLLEVERTRTLIATDLHDDIGSNLSKISVLSEVVRMQIEREGKSDDRLLNSIADISRQSVSSMSDIVWTINPKRDSAWEIVRKMREHAEEMFVPKGISIKFFAPEKSEKIKLSMNLRRDLYLIFKEATNNIAKHSNAEKVEISFDIRHHEIFLQIEDDGDGFDISEQKNGNGLINMQTRVEKLNGDFQIESAPKKGTKITIHLPQK